MRIIPSPFPPVDLFERVADPEDFEALYEVDVLTNERLRDDVWEIQLVPREDRVHGPGASHIVAPFTHRNPAGSRFSDGSFGVYYTACDRKTAVTETCWHRARFLAWTKEAPTELDMRVLEAKLAAELHDLRPLTPELPSIHHPDDYSASRALGHRPRDAGSYGIACHSVRRPGGSAPPCSARGRCRSADRRSTSCTHGTGNGSGRCTRRGCTAPDRRLTPAGFAWKTHLISPLPGTNCGRRMSS